MLFFDSIRNFFSPAFPVVRDRATPAPACEYSIKPLTSAHLKETLLLNVRCFPNGDSYTRHTFDYLLNLPTTLSYRAVTESGQIVGFAFVMMTDQGSAHLTTIGIAPEHRRRGIARQLLDHLEKALAAKHVNSIALEVRVGNTSAQHLYKTNGYYTVQRLPRYYNDGEDCFLMMKAVY